jgi:hypothetical protein
MIVSCICLLLLDTDWPGLFRKNTLLTIPVDKAAKHSNATFGRTTKELYAILVALAPQLA